MTYLSCHCCPHQTQHISAFTLHSGLVSTPFYAIPICSSTIYNFLIYLYHTIYNIFSLEFPFHLFLTLIFFKCEMKCIVKVKTQIFKCTGLMLSALCNPGEQYLFLVGNSSRSLFFMPRATHSTHGIYFLCHGLGNTYNSSAVSTAYTRKMCNSMQSYIITSAHHVCM